MREKKYRQTGKESLSSRHPIRQQLMAALLGLCLVVVSIPVPKLSLSVQAAQPHAEASEPSEPVEKNVTGDNGEGDGSEDGTGVTVSFYSGSAGNKVTRILDLDDSAGSRTITVPELEPLYGFEAVGYSTAPDSFEGGIKAGSGITPAGSAVYYGVYQKQVTLSYNANGGDVCPQSETQICRANVGEQIFYDTPTFKAAAPVPRAGYVFAGWNTAEDGMGDPFLAEEDVQTGSNITLYAMWVAGNYTPYRIEHYRQNLEDDGYTRVDADTEYMEGLPGERVEAEANPYTGFSVSSNPALGKSSGIVEADGSLVLQMYYDRDVYEINFDLNTGEDQIFEKQMVRYGGLLREMEEPQRKGYTFEGWYKDKNCSEAAYWNPYETVEENTKALTTTLYAKWTDKTAPVLGKASFAEGYRNFTDWVISQNKLVITVPVIEDGSGLKQGAYTLIPEKGEAQEGTAEIRTDYTLSSGVQARSGGIAAVMTMRGNARDGEYEIVITIEDEFKGSVALTCTDDAGNTSVEKILTADGAGVIVEDNAPDIQFSKAEDEAAKGRAMVNVDVTDNAGENVTAGIAEISYQIDEGKAKAEGKEDFADAMVEDYSFAVEIKGEGEHTLAVTAVDNAGNKSTRKVTVEILKKKAVIVPNSQTPTQKTPTKQMPGRATGEPVTGESTHVKVFATLGMVAGFTYLLLYFTSGESGITEDEKEEIISRLVRWAGKGKLRKYPALIVIMLFLAYYHSIGKSVSSEWRKVCEG